MLVGLAHIHPLLRCALSGICGANSDAPAGQQLDALEGWFDRQKDHDAGDWPEAGAFTGGKRDRHESADDFQA